MQVYGKNGYTAEIPVEIPKKVIAQELVAADGNTTLNTSNNNLDETNLDETHFMQKHCRNKYGRKKG